MANLANLSREVSARAALRSVCELVGTQWPGLESESMSMAHITTREERRRVRPELLLAVEGAKAAEFLKV